MNERSPRIPKLPPKAGEKPDDQRAVAFAEQIARIHEQIMRELADTTPPLPSPSLDKLNKAIDQLLAAGRESWRRQFLASYKAHGAGDDGQTWAERQARILNNETAGTADPDDPDHVDEHDVLSSE